ncbi:hypothetical protein YQE_03179, partial [Dendroctonus ponderosae]
MGLVLGKCNNKIAEALRTHANKGQGEWFQKDSGR